MNIHEYQAKQILARAGVAHLRICEAKRTIVGFPEEHLQFPTLFSRG